MVFTLFNIAGVNLMAKDYDDRNISDICIQNDLDINKIIY